MTFGFQKFDDTLEGHCRLRGMLSRLHHHWSIWEVWHIFANDNSFDLSSRLQSDIFTSHGERCHSLSWEMMCLWLGQLVEFVVFFCGFRFLLVSFLGAARFPWPVLLVKVQLERDEMWWGLSNWKVLLIYDIFHILDDGHLVGVWPTWSYLIHQ